MMSWPILSVTTFLPLVGALFIMMLRSEGEAEKRNARWIALWTTLITFAIYGFAMTVVAAGMTAFYSWRLIYKTFHGAPHDPHHYEAARESPLVILVPLGVLAIGFVVAWEFYIRRPELPAELARQHEPLYKFLLNKWYFDELYDFLVVRPTLWLGRVLWKYGDGWMIDGLGPDGVSARVLDVTRNVMRLQTGYLYHYAFAMLIGIAAFITWFMFGGRVG